MATNDPKMTKAERREAARAEAQRLREEAQRRDKRNRMLIISGVLGGLVVVIAAIAFIIIIGGNNQDQVDYFAQEETITIPTGTDENGGIPISTDLVAGTPGTGVRVDIYTDYTCHYCAAFESQYSDALDQMITSGEAQVWLHPVAIMDASNGAYTDYSGMAVAAAAAVAQQAPEYFVDFHTALFQVWSDAVAQYQTDPTTPLPGLADIQAAAASVGVPQDVIATFGDPEWTGFARATTTTFVTQREQPGTPEIQVDGEILTNWPDPNALQDAVAAATSGQ